MTLLRVAGFAPSLSPWPDMNPPRASYSRSPVLALAFVVVGISGARAAPGLEEPLRCDHDLALVIEWTGTQWAVTDPSTTHPEFEACQGRSVTWTLGATPGDRKHVAAWIQIDPRVFDTSSALDASSGFAIVADGQALTLRIRDDAPLDSLNYAVLCMNLNELSPGQIKKLGDDVKGRRFGQLRRFENLTFAQQDSPPRMIIK